MTTKKLRNKILDLAIHGRLVKQDPNDEPASALLARIRAEKEQLVKEGKLKKKDLVSEPIADEDKPFEIPESWEWCRLGDIAFVTKLAGFEYTKYIADNLTSTNGIPLFKGKNVQSGEIIYDFETYIPETISDNLSRSQITKPCLLTPYVGTIGNIGYHKKNGKFHLGSNVGKIEFYCPNEYLDIVNSFALLFLRSKSGLAELSKYKKATAQESISIQAIREVILPLPPLAEQQRIVAAVEQWMSLIDVIESGQENLQQSIALAKNKIFDLAIKGKLVPQDANDEPASVLLEHIRKEKEQLVKEGKLKKKDLVTTPVSDEDKPFEVPEGWEWTNIGNVLINRDAERVPLSSAVRKKQDNRIFDYYGATGVVDKVDSYLFDERLMLIGEDGANLLSRSKNNAFFAEGKYWVNNHAHILDCIDKKVLDYIAMVINSMSLEKYVTGSAQPKLNQDNLNKIPIPLPPLAEQHRIVAKIEELFAQLDNIANALK